MSQVKGGDEMRDSDESHTRSDFRIFCGFFGALPGSIQKNTVYKYITEDKLDMKTMRYSNSFHHHIFFTSITKK